MQIGTIVGHATSTVKHPSLQGWRLLLVQMLGTGDKPDGEPVLAIDNLGAAQGSRVILTSEGGSIRQLVKAKNSPARWMVLGIADE